MDIQGPVSVERARQRSAGPISAPRSFTDARPASATHNVLQEMADNSAQVARLKMLSGMLDDSPRMLQLKAYAHSINNGPDAAANLGPPAVVQRVNWDLVRNDPAIEIRAEGPDFAANFRGERAGTLELYQDESGREWINNIIVEERFQRRGIGLSLLNAAVQMHGEIYAATGMHRDDEVGDDDTRHLSDEGLALVNSALRNDVLQDDWCFNPAEEREAEFGAEFGGEWQEQEGSSGEEIGVGEEMAATCTAVVVLDDSNTGGMGYQYWVELTNVANGEMRTVEFDDLIPGEESLTTGALEAALSRALGGDIELASWEIDYAD